MEDIDKRLRRHTQLEFLRGFFDRWDVLRKSEREEDREKACVPSHYPWVQACFLHLHWLLYQEADRYYNFFGVPESTANRIHRWVRNIVCSLFTTLMVLAW